MTNALFSAAMRQWTTGTELDSLATLAGLQLLSLTATFLGQGSTSTKLLGNAINMGKRMRLLTNGTSIPVAVQLEGADLKATCHAAWGLFSYSTYVFHDNVQVYLLTFPAYIHFTARKAKLDHTLHKGY